MFNIGAGEIAVILVVALLVLGPKRLPELARGIGKFMREFRRQTDEMRTTLETEFYRMDQDLLRENPRPPPALEPIPQQVDPAAPIPQLPPEANPYPVIHGPLDGGRRVADQVAPRKPLVPEAPQGTASGEPASAAPAPAEPDTETKDGPR